MSDPVVEHPRQLEPLPYHGQLRDFLQREEAEIWNWYASNRVREEEAEQVRFELLKSTYRIARDAQPDWYRLAETAAEKLSLDVPITIYQAQTSEGMNASLAYLTSEAHIILSGPVAEKLSAEELLAVFAHELSHLLLWRTWDGELLLVDQILAALTYDRSAEPAHFASARLFQLYSEIFCDRGALFVAADPLVVISGLVKVHTGLETVSAESYVRQAEEIFAKHKKPSQSLTHPEAYIRTRAVQLWQAADDDVESKISQMIEGPPVLEELDLLGQVKVARLTERLLIRLLVHPWLRTDSVLGHARLYFDGFEPPGGKHQDDALADDLKTDDKGLIDYYCYVLLDFVTADRDLEEAPLAAALVEAEALGLKDRFTELVRKELKLRKRQFDKIDNEKHDLLARAAKELVGS